MIPSSPPSRSLRRGAIDSRLVNDDLDGPATLYKHAGMVDGQVLIRYVTATQGPGDPLEVQPPALMCQPVLHQAAVETVPAPTALVWAVVARDLNRRA